MIAAAKGIIQGQRGSHTKVKEQKEVTRILRKFHNENELTFLVNLWQVLLNKVRHVQNKTKPGSETSQDLIEERAEAMQWIEQAWVADHLKCNWAKPFLSDWLPPVNMPADGFEAQILSETKKLQKPVPDLTYGLEREAFDERAQYINDVKSRVLLANMYHAFFVVEVQSAKGTLADAKNQCARGGGACSLASHEFVQHAKGLTHKSGNNNNNNTKNDEVLGADEKSLTFSLAVTPDFAHMHVHWVEQRKEKKLITHMHILASYDFQSQEKLRDLRHDIDNILDWGVLTRKNQTVQLCKEIDELEGGESQGKKPNTGGS